MAWFRWQGEDILLDLRIQPKASKDEFVGPHGEEFKLRITAPPVDGKANAHLRKFLAKAFGVKQAAVIVESGESGRSKRVRIQAPKRFPIKLE